jgi:cAMP phosphodiesterase
MLMIRKIFVLLFFIGLSQILNAQSFKIIPLGVLGGSDESNLSSYMIAPKGSENYVCLDAGTLKAGLEKAVKKHLFKAGATDVLKNNIKGYLISHGHLDHLSGLILNSPDDSPKPIYAMPYVIDVFKKHYFSWDTWANFANEGEKPALAKYHYVGLNPKQEIPLENTSMLVTSFELSHAKPYQSTAFLVRSNQDYVLYLGDTGADRLEQSDKLNQLWKAVAPLIENHQLKAILIEVSFPNSQSEKQLFGHLTPKLLMEEMQHLSTYAGLDAMRNLNVVITHMKPVEHHIETIKKEVKAENQLSLNIIFPKQGKEMDF